MDLSSLARGQRTAGRLAHIVAILCKYSLADWLKAVNVRPVRKFLTSFDGQPIAGLPTEVRIRMALTEMGTTFIKLGQILSTRPDVVGPVLADELSSLQDDTPADTPETVRALIEAELHRPIKELFAEFEDTAFASASIGQVHRARLRDGRQVVVKVLHHNIEAKVATDLDIMMALAELGEKYSAETAELSAARHHDASFAARCCANWIFAASCATSRSSFTTSRAIRPSAFRRRIRPCRRSRVLTLDYLDGIRIADTERLKWEGHDLRDDRAPRRQHRPRHDFPRRLLSRRSAPRQPAGAAEHGHRRARLRHGRPDRRPHARRLHDDAAVGHRQAIPASLPTW